VEYNFEQALQISYQSILKPGDIAVDVGAHVGRHTLPMAEKVAPNGRVLAFEPLPACQAEFNALFAPPERAALKKLVTLSRCALSDHSGRDTFIVAVDSLAYSGLRERVYDSPTRLERIEVQVEQLDSFLKDVKSVKFIKIDAEGGEYHILKGAEVALARHRPVVSIEFGANSLQKYEIGPPEMADLASKHRYRIFDIRGRELQRESFIHSATIQEVWDYLLVPQESNAFESAIGPALSAYARSVA
jgi:FkbM family methyltransferase